VAAARGTAIAAAADAEAGLGKRSDTAVAMAGEAPRRLFNVAPAAIKEHEAASFNEKGLEANRQGDTPAALANFLQAVALAPAKASYMLSAANMMTKLEPPWTAQALELYETCRALPELTDKEAAMLLKHLALARKAAKLEADARKEAERVAAEAQEAEAAARLSGAAANIDDEWVEASTRSQPLEEPRVVKIGDQKDAGSAATLSVGRVPSAAAVAPRHGSPSARSSQLSWLAGKEQEEKKREEDDASLMRASAWHQPPGLQESKSQSGGFLGGLARFFRV